MPHPTLPTAGFGVGGGCSSCDSRDAFSDELMFVNGRRTQVERFYTQRDVSKKLT